MTQEQRQFERTDQEVDIEVTHPELGVMKMKTKDTSDGGMYVLLEGNDAISVGSMVSVRYLNEPGSESLSMLVVRNDGEGLGLMIAF